MAPIKDGFSAGEKIDILRKRRGWTLIELGEKVHFSESTAARIVRGERTISPDELALFARVLEVDVDVLRS